MSILQLREKRAEFIKNKIKNNNQTLVCIKANYPGPDKRNLYANYTVFAIYNNLNKIFDISDISHEFDIDGFIFIALIDESPHSVKSKTIEIENSHKLGRLVDIDVYDQNGIQISREIYNMPRRKCYICDKEAVICTKSKRHDIDILIDFYKDVVLNYLFLSCENLHLVEFCLFNELMRNISLGSVIPNSNGSHDDMDFYTFLKGIDSLSYSLNKIKYIDTKSFSKLREFGLKCEKNLYLSTYGINTHKGVIFAFIIILAALVNSKSFSELQQNISELGKQSLNDFGSSSDSNGLKVYNEYKLLGARGEAADGYKSAFEIYIPILENGASIDDLFLNIALNTDDTNAIHRCGMEDYLSYKKQIEDILVGKGDLSSLENFCIEKKISPGGSCDMISISLLLWSIKKNFFEFKEVLKCR
ncbi:MAG: citrate lyase holo-[acyl-carrier protein] synthase [Tissierellia bacterium]|nr:citrate lyase holo-[acyl-carrier protein] synthase [Tissierellia bacterium]